MPVLDSPRRGSPRQSQRPGGREAAIDHDLDLTAEANPRSARELRLQFEQWLHAAGATPAVADDLCLAVYEGLANATEHAYPPDHPDPVLRLHARLDGDRVHATVADHGNWSPPGDSGYRGRGLAMMGDLTTHIDIDPTPHGTTVHLHAALRPADTDGTAP